MAENHNNPDSDPIEPWLEAYAQNRRKELDEPIELDEPTRTMLQGEVERVYPKQQAEATVENGMPAWLPWVMGGAVCALAIVVSLDLNSGSKSKPMEMAKADPVTEESGEDSKASGENVRNETPEVVASNTDKERSISRSSDGGVRDLSNLKDLRPEAVPAPSILSTTVAPAPTTIKKRNLSVQPSVKPPSSLMRGGGLRTPRRANSPAPAPRAIRSAAPASKALTARSLPAPRGRGAQPEPNYYSNLSQLRQNFRQASVISDTSSVRKQKTIPQPVLVNFQVERSGNLVKILDQDGSVYTGNVINEEKYANSGSGIGPAKAKLKQQKGQTPSQPGIRARATVSQDQGQFYFRVRGNNRTLQQMVVIEATLDGMSAENGKLGYSNRSFSAPPKLARSLPLPGAGSSAEKKEAEKLAKAAGKKADDRVALSVPQLRLLGNTRIGKANYRLDAYQTPSGSYRPAVKTKAAAPAPKKK